MKVKRAKPLNFKVLNQLIKIGQDPNLSFKEIMEQIPVTYRQIRWVRDKGQIPKRCFDPDKLYVFRSNGGLSGAMTRWGYHNDDR